MAMTISFATWQSSHVADLSQQHERVQTVGERGMGERQLGVAVDLSPTSKYALGWALEHIARDGDEVVVFVVVKKKDSGDVHLWEKSGTPLIPMHDYDEHVMDKYGIKPDPEVFAIIRQAREKKNINVNGKIYYGDAREKLLDAVNEHKLQMLIIGSRGLGTVKRALLGSVSNYVINNAPCPVTVVKMPECA